jgi:hypothetical protein
VEEETVPEVFSESPEEVRDSEEEPAVPHEARVKKLPIVKTKSR